MLRPRTDTWDSERHREHAAHAWRRGRRPRRSQRCDRDVARLRRRICASTSSSWARGAESASLTPLGHATGTRAPAATSRVWVGFGRDPCAETQRARTVPHVRRRATPLSALRAIPSSGGAMRPAPTSTSGIRPGIRRRAIARIVSVLCPRRRRRHDQRIARRRPPQGLRHHRA